MSARAPTIVPLADLLALSILEHGPSSGSDLSIRVAARKESVLRELEANPRFERLGRGRGSRWRIAREPLRAPWEPMGTDSGARLDLDTGQSAGDRLAALERRVARLESARPSAAPMERLRRRDPTLGCDPAGIAKAIAPGHDNRRE